MGVGHIGSHFLYQFNGLNASVSVEESERSSNIHRVGDDVPRFAPMKLRHPKRHEFRDVALIVPGNGKVSILAAAKMGFTAMSGREACPLLPNTCHDNMAIPVMMEPSLI